MDDSDPILPLRSICINQTWWNVKKVTNPTGTAPSYKRECRKRKHPTEDDARIFQISITGDKPFWIYSCPLCNYEYYHVSMSGLPRHIQDDFVAMIQAGSKDAHCIKHKSQSKTIFDIDYHDSTYRVIYCKTTKKVQVIG